jgi:hypothetical protein
MSASKYALNALNDKSVEIPYFPTRLFLRVCHFLPCVSLHCLLKLAACKMETIVLLPDFDMSQDDVRKLAAESQASGEPLNIEIPIAGMLYHTDSEELATQFLYAAYIGQMIGDTCSEFECETPSSLDAHESVEFYVVPKDVEAFVTKLWDAIPGFMSEELQEQYGYDEMHAAEVMAEGWDYLEKPESATYTSDLVEHASQILEIGGYGDEEDDEEDEEDEEEGR